MKKILCAFMSLLLILSVFSVAVSAIEETTFPAQEEQTTVEATEPTTEETTDENTTNEPTTDGGVVLPEETIPNVKEIASPVSVICQTTKSGFDISWSSVAEASAYNVYRRASGEADFKLITTVLEKDTAKDDHYTDADVKSGVYYLYAVSCVSEEYESEYKESSLVRYIASPVISAQNTLKGVCIKWRLVTGASNYIVYRRDAGQKEAKFLARVAGTSTSFVDVNVKSGFYYEYFVVASSDSKTDKYTSAKNGANVVLKHIGPAKVVFLYNQNEGVEVHWYAVSGATGYRVYRRAAGEKYFTYLNTAKNSPYTDKTAVSGQFYTYVVKATSNSYLGEYEDAHKVIRRLTAPQIIAAANGNDGIYVKWKLVPGASEYQVWRRNAGAKDFVFVGKSTSDRYKDTSVVYGKYYAYKVKAVYQRTTSQLSPNQVVWKFVPLNGKVTGTVAFNMYKDAVEVAKKTPNVSFNMKTWAKCASASGTGTYDEVVNVIVKDFKNSFVSEREAKVYTFKNGYGNEIIPPCDLTYANVKSATSVKKGNNYVVTIVFNRLNMGFENRDFRKVASVYVDSQDYLDALASQISMSDGYWGTQYDNFTIVAEITPAGKIVRLEQRGLAICDFGGKMSDYGYFNIDGKVNSYCQYYNFKY